MILPRITIIITTFNEAHTIKRCLTSIFRQNYPRDKLEVIVVDNISRDKTVEIAKKFPVKILLNKGEKNSIISKRIGFDYSKGRYYMWFDSDMEFSSKNSIKRLIIPFLEDPSIVGSFGHFITKGDESPLTRFFNMDHNQRDPVFQFFTPSIQDTIIEKRKNYSICYYTQGRIPPHCIGFLRSDIVKKTLHLQGNKLMELDILVHLVNMKFNRFAFSSVGIYHYFLPNLKTLAKKRIRHIKRNYLGQTFKRTYTWFNLKNPKDIVKIIAWIIYAHLIIPETIRGGYKAIKYKTWVGLYQPVVSLMETDVIIAGFIYYYMYFSIKKFRSRTRKI